MGKYYTNIAWMILKKTLEYIGFRGLSYWPKPKAEDNTKDRENRYIQCYLKDHSIFILNNSDKTATE